MLEQINHRNINIKNYKELNEIIRLLQLQVQEKEERVGQKVLLLPGYLLKKLATGGIAIFLANKITFNSIGMINQGLKLLFRSKKKNQQEYTKEKLKKNTKKFAIFSAISSLFTSWVKKKHH